MPSALHMLTAKVLLPIPGVPDMVTTLPLMHSKIKPKEVEDINLCCRVPNFSPCPICSHSLSNFTAVTNSSLSELKGRSGVKVLGEPATVFASSPRSSRRDEGAVCRGCCPFSRDGVSLIGTAEATPGSACGFLRTCGDELGSVCCFLLKGGGAPQRRCTRGG